MSDNKIPTQKRIAAFTDRELQCIFQIIDGKTVPEIVKNLQLSQSTIYYHIANIKKRLLKLLILK